MLEPVVAEKPPHNLSLSESIAQQKINERAADIFEAKEILIHDPKFEGFFKVLAAMQAHGFNAFGESLEDLMTKVLDVGEPDQQFAFKEMLISAISGHQWSKYCIHFLRTQGKHLTQKSTFYQAAEVIYTYWNQMIRSSFTLFLQTYKDMRLSELNQFMNALAPLKFYDNLDEKPISVYVDDQLFDALTQIKLLGKRAPQVPFFTVADFNGFLEAIDRLLLDLQEGRLQRNQNIFFANKIPQYPFQKAAILWINKLESRNQDLQAGVSAAVRDFQSQLTEQLKVIQAFKRQNTKLADQLAQDAEAHLVALAAKDAQQQDQLALIQKLTTENSYMAGENARNVKIITQLDDRIIREEELKQQLLASKDDQIKSQQDYIASLEEQNVELRKEIAILSKLHAKASVSLDQVTSELETSKTQYEELLATEQESYELSTPTRQGESPWRQAAAQFSPRNPNSASRSLTFEQSDPDNSQKMEN